MTRSAAAIVRPARRWLNAASAAILFIVAGVAPAQTSEEVPFISTPDPVTRAMLQLARVKRTDYVIDLGSGDGRIVILAAQRFGARGLGVEIDPTLVERSLANAQRAGVAQRVEFREQDLFNTDLSAATVITMYLLPEVNLQLRPRLLALKPGTRIVSHDWDLGDWPPDRTLTIDVPDKAVGREKLSRVHLWVVPAGVDGVWCSVGKAHALRLEIAQTYQRFRAEFDAKLALPAIEGQIAGRRLNANAAPANELQWAVIGSQLRVTRARGIHAPLAARVFERAVDGSTCTPAR